MSNQEAQYAACRSSEAALRPSPPHCNGRRALREKLQARKAEQGRQAPVNCANVRRSKEQGGSRRQHAEEVGSRPSKA